MPTELHVCGETPPGRGPIPNSAERIVRAPLEDEARRRGIRDVSRWSTRALRIAVVAMRRNGEGR